MDINALSRLIIWLLLLSMFARETAAQLPAKSRQRVHLYLLAGQSNMAGRGAVDTMDKTPHPRVWVLNHANEWIPATEPLHFDKPAVVGVGPGLAFGKLMAEADTSIVIGLIPAAVGGSGIDSWQPGGFHEQTKTYPYDDAIRRVKTALGSGTLRGILWHQGESDTKPELAGGYADKLTRLIKRFRTDLSANQLPVVVGTLGDFYAVKNPTTSRINEAIRTVTQRERRVACVDATGLTDKGDKTHFDAPSARELGRRYAEAMKKLQTQK